MTAFSTTTPIDLDSFAARRAGPASDAMIRGVWCEAEAVHLIDNAGKAYSLVEVSYATDEGEPMCEVDVDSHVDLTGLLKLLADLSRGHEPAGAYVTWANSYGQVA